MSTDLTLPDEPLTGEIVPIAALPPDRNPARVYLASLGSPHSRRTMRAALDAIANLVQKDATLDTLPWHRLRFQHTAAIRAQLAQTYAPATANKMLCALRGALKAAWQLGYVHADDYQRAIDVKAVRGETLPAGRDVDTGEIAALGRACEADPTPAGPRDAAIIALAVAGGLRRSEIAALDLADYDAETGRLTVRGKGNKERAAYLAGGAADALADWLAVRGGAPGALLCPVRRGGAVEVRRLTAQAVYDAMKKRAGQAGVNAFSPHDLRRAFVGDLLDAGADISTVAALAGHASVTTTQRYDRRPEGTKRDAARLLHFPWHRRR